MDLITENTRIATLLFENSCTNHSLLCLVTDDSDRIDGAASSLSKFPPLLEWEEQLLMAVLMMVDGVSMTYKRCFKIAGVEHKDPECNSRKFQTHRFGGTCMLFFSYYLQVLCCSHSFHLLNAWEVSMVMGATWRLVCWPDLVGFKSWKDVTAFWLTCRLTYQSMNAHIQSAANYLVSKLMTQTVLTLLYRLD